MINVMNAQWYKNWRSKITYVIIGILVAMQAVCYIIFFWMKYYRKGAISTVFSDASAVNYFTSAFNGDATFLLVGILGIGILAADYSSGSIRQICSHQYTRRQILLGQYFSITILTMLIFMIFAIGQALLGGLAGGVGHITPVRLLLVIIGDCSMIFAMSSIALLFITVIKTSGVAISLFTLFSMFGGGIAQLLAFLTKQTFWVRYWIGNIKDCAVDITKPVGGQIKYSLLLMGIAVICCALSQLYFRMRDID